MAHAGKHGEEVGTEERGDSAEHGIFFYRR